ncbi:MAG TPA: DUF402 domain-containing protein [Nocardioidaceae bacterium]|nr:DUF402 domain-containing protein [Nocardioidaceae bacterium]
MDEVRMVFSKWGGRPHWECDTLALGADEHGRWLGLPSGTLVTRPGAAFSADVPQVVLLPDSAYVATFYAPGGSSPCETYVDISTVPLEDDGRITAVDLDLDVIRGWTGRVWVDDEDEFADHRVRFGYPEEVVELAVTSCEQVRRAVAASQAPFDGTTARRWLEVLEGAMMA